MRGKERKQRERKRLAQEYVKITVVVKIGAKFRLFLCWDCCLVAGFSWQKKSNIMETNC